MIINTKTSFGNVWIISTSNRWADTYAIQTSTEVGSLPQSANNDTMSTSQKVWGKNMNPFLLPLELAPLLKALPLSANTATMSTSLSSLSLFFLCIKVEVWPNACVGGGWAYSDNSK